MRTDRYYDHIFASEDTWDKGSIYRMYMIRKQAAIDMTHKPEEGIFIKEQDIDGWVIANDDDDEDDSSIIAVQQQYQAVQEKIRAAIQGLHRDATRLPPNPTLARTAHTEHDWDFFYHSLLAAPETRSAILTTKSSGKKPVLKSEDNHTFRTHRQEATRNASRHMEATQRQRHCRHRRSGDEHAGESSKPNACRAQPPRRATRHCSQIRQRRDRDHRAISRHRPL